MMREFLAGFGTMFRAVGLVLRNPSMIPLFIVPALLTLILLIGLGWSAYAAIAWGLSTWLEGEGAWQGTLRWAVYIIAFPAVVIVGYLVFTQVGSIVAIPFNDPLSKKAESACLKADDSIVIVEGSAVADSTARSIARAGTDGIRMTAKVLSAQIAMLPVLLVPVAGAGIYLACVSYFTGAEYLDMVLSRHCFTWAEKKSITRGSRMRVLGLGTATGLCMLIPFTILFVLPLSVVGGTLLYLDLVQAGRIEGPSADAEESGTSKE